MSRKHRVILVDALDRKIEFESIAQAAKFAEVDESTIRKAIINDSVVKSSYKVLVPDFIVGNNKTTVLQDGIEEIKDMKITNNSYTETHLIIPDVHIPYPDIITLQKIISMTKNVEINGIHILGDFLDCTALSSHDIGKISNGVPLDEEYSIGNYYLDWLTKYLPDNASKTYIMGNHENRFKKILSLQEYSKINRAIISPENGLRLVDRGFEVINDYPNGFKRVGDVELIHGIYLTANHPKKHLDKIRNNVMYGHTHTFRDFTENSITSYNIGHLVNVNAPIFNYTDRFAKKDWQTGFALIRIKDGITFVEKIKVINGHFFVNGIYY